MPTDTMNRFIQGWTFAEKMWKEQERKKMEKSLSGLFSPEEMMMLKYDPRLLSLLQRKRGEPFKEEQRGVQREQWEFQREQREAEQTKTGEQELEKLRALTSSEKVLADWEERKRFPLGRPKAEWEAKALYPERYRKKTVGKPTEKIKKKKDHITGYEKWRLKAEHPSGATEEQKKRKYVQGVIRPERLEAKRQLGISEPTEKAFEYKAPGLWKTQLGKKVKPPEDFIKWANKNKGIVDWNAIAEDHPDWDLSQFGIIF